MWESRSPPPALPPVPRKPGRPPVNANSPPSNPTAEGAGNPVYMDIDSTGNATIVLDEQGKPVVFQAVAVEGGQLGHAVAVDVQPVDVQPVDIQPVGDAVAVDVQPVDVQPVGDAVAVDVQPVDVQPVGDAVAVDVQPVDVEPVGDAVAVDVQPVDVEPVGDAVAVHVQAVDVQAVATDGAAPVLHPNSPIELPAAEADCKRPSAAYERPLSLEWLNDMPTEEARFMLRSIPGATHPVCALCRVFVYVYIHVCVCVHVCVCGHVCVV